MDNLVLGSTPDFAGNLRRPDVPLVAFSGAQAPPSAGVNGFSDSVRVKEAYAEWQPAFLLRVGRQASHWGLGLLANGGQERDDDFGDYTDRALLLFKVFGVYVAGAWDYVYSGAVTDDPGDFFGQPQDLGSADDVNQFVVALFQKPMSAAEKAKRRVSLREPPFKPAFDWGLYGVVRMQDLDLSGASYEAYRRDGGQLSSDVLQLVPRKAFAVVPDLWFRFEKRFDFVSGIRVELEALGLFGEIENVSDDSATATKARTIQQFGAALEVEIEYEQWGFGLDAGLASGDSATTNYASNAPVIADLDGNPNEEITAFRFDRNYKVDLLLFREMIGTVTNAFYIKPWASYDFFEGPESALGFRLDLLYAQAMEAEGTPGREAFLGAEADLRLFYEELDRFNLDLEAGFLIPGDAFKYIAADPANNRDPEFAFTLQARMSFLF